MWPRGNLMIGTAFIYLAITVFGQSTELPVSNSCGRPAFEPSVLSDTRILGGEDAVSGSWPWQVRIGERVTGGVSFFCGGAIYNRQFILTAGHCFPGSSPSSPKKYVVRVGEHNMSVFESYERDYGVLQIYRHPNYTYRGAPANDLALVRLSYPLQFSDRISAVCLPTSMNDPVPGEECVVTGWGRFLDQYSYSTYSPSTTTETTAKTTAEDGFDPDDDPTPPPGATSDANRADEIQNSQTSVSSAQDASSATTITSPIPTTGSTATSPMSTKETSPTSATSVSTISTVTTSAPTTATVWTVPTSNPAISSSGRLLGAARDIITASTTTTTHVVTPSTTIPTMTTTMQTTTATTTVTTPSTTTPTTPTTTTTTTTTSTTTSSTTTPTTTSTTMTSTDATSTGPTTSSPVKENATPEETSTVTTTEPATRTSTKTPTKRTSTTRKQLSWNDLLKPLLEAVITSDLDEKEVFSVVTTRPVARPGRRDHWHDVVKPAVIHTGNVQPFRGHRVARRDAATVPPLQYASINVHSEVLKQGVVPVISRANCSAYWTSLIRDTMMCTMPPSADIEPCKGDSGGPLVCPKGNGLDKVWSIEGIISFGAGCGAKRPSVYTRVSSYVHWIERVTKSATTKPSSLSALLSQFLSRASNAKKGKRETLESFPDIVNDV